MMTNKNQGENLKPDKGVTLKGDTHRPALTLDVALYEQYLADTGLTDSEKQAFLETLWNIIVTFVDLGFGIEPVSQACKQNQTLPQLEQNDVLGLLHPLPSETFSTVASHAETDHPEGRES